MDPKHLNNDELVNYAAGIDLGPVAQPWIDALADALASVMDENKELKNDLEVSEDAARAHGNAEESALNKADEWEDKYLRTLGELEDLKDELRELQFRMDGLDK